MEGNKGSLTFPLHAHDKALLIATVLAAVALTLVDETVFIIPTCVDEVFPYGPLEEPFAAFTAVHPVVLSWLKEKTLHRLFLCLLEPVIQKNPLRLFPREQLGTSPRHWYRLQIIISRECRLDHKNQTKTE